MQTKPFLIYTMSLTTAFSPSFASCNVQARLRPRTAGDGGGQQVCHSLHFRQRIRCTAAGQAPARRSANFQPNIWSDDYIQSLTGVDYTVETKDLWASRADELKEKVRKLFYQKKEVEEQLQLIDQLQNFGVAYHFKDEIKSALRGIHASLEHTSLMFKDDLYATSLLFRLLRQNGFSVSEEIFSQFRDENGHFLQNNHPAGAVLSLYEASYFEKEGEVVLHEAMDSTTRYLKSLIDTGESTDCHLKDEMAHALGLPLNWRAQRLHHRWFIEAYCQRKEKSNPTLLEFAKLDFSMLQSTYRRELKQASRWWTELGLPKKLPFFRDRLTENYFWTIGWAFEPECWRYRELQTKTNCLITMVDDVYDVYGTLDELELFTDIVDRWDVNAIDQLPEYMKLCFLAVFNTVNDATYRTLKERGLDISPFLKRAWADLCKSYLIEAKWFDQGYTPKLNEYLDIAWITISGPLCLTDAYCMGEELTKEELERFIDYSEIIRTSSMLFRLYDDLGTSANEIKRGDVSKSIQCWMKEKDVSEDVARQHVWGLIRENWRKLNGLCQSSSSSFDDYFKGVALDAARMTHFMYHDRDGYGLSDGETKEQIISMLIDPII